MIMVFIYCKVDHIFIDLIIEVVSAPMFFLFE